MRVILLITCLFCGLIQPATAQSFNIALGPSNQQPAASYAAAGSPGYWNALPAPHNTNTFNLVDINGVITNVRLNQYGGTFLISEDDAGTTGDDQTLMDHCLVTYNSSLETCIFLYNLIDGEYEVIIYAMMPNRPDVMSYCSSDEEPGYPHKIIGGAWPGAHQLGVTYSRHISQAGQAFPGLLRLHSGIVPGHEPADGAAMNGVQIRLLPTPTPGDLNCDGAINGMDVEVFLLAMTNPELYWERTENCNIRNADLNGDQSIDKFDIPPFVTALLGV